MKKAPALRFKGFTNDWEQRKLGDVLSKFDYGLNSASSDYDGKNKYLRITDIDEQTHRFNLDNLTSPKVDLKNKDNYILHPGDIVFARTGASVGKTYKYREDDGRVYFAGFLIRGRINKNFDTSFIFDTTLLPKYSNFVKITSIRSGQPGINSDEYKKYVINIPTINEQKYISKLITNLEELITLQQRKLSQLKLLKNALLKRMFTAKKSPTLRFRDFSKDWKLHKLQDITDRLDNARVPVTASKRIAGSTPYYGANGIQDYVKGYTHDGEFLLVAEDGANNINDYPVICAKGKIWVNNHAHVLQAKNKKIDILFLMYALKFLNMKKYLVGGSRSKLNAETMMKLALKLPELDEEHNIGVLIKNMDVLITQYKYRIQKINKFKQFLLQNMFI